MSREQEINAVDRALAVVRNGCSCDDCLNAITTGIAALQDVRAKREAHTATVHRVGGACVCKWDDTFNCGSPQCKKPVR